MRPLPIAYSVLGLVVVGLCFALWREFAENQRLTSHLRQSKPPAGSNVQTSAQEATSAPAANAVEKSGSQVVSAPSLHRASDAPADAKRLKLQQVIAKIEWDPQAEKFDAVEDYMPILRGLNLPPRTLAKVKGLLFERLQGVSEAREIAEQSGLKLGDVGAAMNRTRDDIDREIQTAAGPTAGAEIKRMLDLPIALGKVVATYAPEMAFAGQPLNGRQALDLAGIMNDIYDVPDASNLDAEANTAYHTKDIDPSTGLSAPDRVALRRAATSLSRQQLTVLQENLAAVTSRYVALKLASQITNKK